MSSKLDIYKVGFLLAMGIIVLLILMKQYSIAAFIYLIALMSALVLQRGLKEKDERERIIIYKASYYSFFIVMMLIGVLYIANPGNIILSILLFSGLLSHCLLYVYYDRKGIKV